jgi:MYXO-CTERM domain-containing protein
MKIYPHLVIIAAGLLALAEGRAQVIVLNVPVSEALGSNPNRLYMPMDSIVGTVSDSAYTPDLSHGNNGRLNDGTNDVLPSLTTGRFGNAVKVEGTTNVNDINPWVYTFSNSDNALYLAQTSFTMGIWIQIDTIKSGTSYALDLFSYGTASSSASSGYSFILNKSSADLWSLSFQTRDGTSTGSTSTSNSDWNLQDGDWHHLGVSLAYGETSSAVVFWVDGVQVGSGNISVPIVDAFRNLNIGERGAATWWDWYDGAYDDAFIQTGVYAFSPVPEPGAAVLALIGLALSAAGSRRRSNRREA